MAPDSRDYRQWFGVLVCAGHSTDAEWLAKIALLLLLADRQGDVLLVTDSTAALTAGLTRAPHPGSLLIVPYRAALAASRARLQEAWLPAQHDSGDLSLLAQLNADTDALADKGAHTALPCSVPWLPMYAGRVLATHQGCLILQPRNAADVIAGQAAEAQYTQAFPSPDRAWSSTLLIAAVETATITPRAVHLTMLHRLLMHQRHPPGYGGVLCPYCHLAFGDIADHLLRGCPPFFLHHLLLAWRLLRHPRVLPLLSRCPSQSSLHHGTEVHTPHVHVGLLTGFQQPSEAPSATHPSLHLRLLGEWRVTCENPRRPPLLATYRQEVYADHLDALSQPAPTLPMVLTAAPDLWPAAAAPLPAGVRAPAGAPPLTIRHSVVLIWLLRRCRAWQLITGHPPSIPLPPAPPPRGHIQPSSSAPSRTLKQKPCPSSSRPRRPCPLWSWLQPRLWTTYSPATTSLLPSYPCLMDSLWAAPSGPLCTLPTGRNLLNEWSTAQCPTRACVPPQPCVHVYFQRTGRVRRTRRQLRQAASTRAEPPMGQTHSHRKQQQGFLFETRGKARDSGLPWTPACLRGLKVTEHPTLKRSTPPPPPPRKTRPLAAPGGAGCSHLLPASARPGGTKEPSGTAGGPHFPGPPSG